MENEISSKYEVEGEMYEIRRLQAEDIKEAREILREWIVWQDVPIMKDIDVILRNMEISLETNDYAPINFYVISSEKGDLVGLYALRDVEEDVRPYLPENNTHSKQLTNMFVGKRSEINSTKTSKLRRIVLNEAINNCRKEGDEVLMIFIGNRYNYLWEFFDNVLYKEVLIPDFYYKGNKFPSMIWKVDIETANFILEQI